MTTVSNRRSLLAIVALALQVATGCNDANPDGPTSPPASATSTAPGADPAAPGAPKTRGEATTKAAASDQ